MCTEPELSPWPTVSGDPEQIREILRVAPCVVLCDALDALCHSCHPEFGSSSHHRREFGADCRGVAVAGVDDGVSGQRHQLGDD